MTPVLPTGFASHARAMCALLAMGIALAGCGALDQAQAPKRYLVISHSALDRLSFFDLDRRKVVGVLPTQKLPHDMLLGEDGRTLYVVNSGGQSISTNSQPGVLAPGVGPGAGGGLTSAAGSSRTSRRRGPVGLGAGGGLTSAASTVRLLG